MRGLRVSYPQTTLEGSPPGSAVRGKLTHQPDQQLPTLHSPPSWQIEMIPQGERLLSWFLLNLLMSCQMCQIDPALAGSLVALPALPDRCPLVIESSNQWLGSNFGHVLAALTTLIRSMDDERMNCNEWKIMENLWKSTKIYENPEPDIWPNQGCNWSPSKSGDLGWRTIQKNPIGPLRQNHARLWFCCG